MLKKEDDALRDYYKQVKSLLYIESTDIISSFSTLINARDKEFWKILDMFARLPPAARIKLILLALDMVESKLYAEKNGGKSSTGYRHIPIIVDPKEQCGKDSCDMKDCKDTSCPTLVHVEVKNRLALMHLREWFFKFAVVAGTLLIIMIVMMLGMGAELPEGVMGDVIGGVVELAKLIIAS